MKTSGDEVRDGVHVNGHVNDGDNSAMKVVGDYLDEARVVVDLAVSSRKRLFQHLAKMLAVEDDDAENNPRDLDTVLHTLTRREKLGCTGLGGGIALPHGRIDGLAEPLIAVARLHEAIDYEAPDGVPVWLAVCVIAPSQANETHLQLLAALAQGFSSADFCARVKGAKSAAEVAAYFQAMPIVDTDKTDTPSATAT